MRPVPRWLTSRVQCAAPLPGRPQREDGLQAAPAAQVLGGAQLRGWLLQVQVGPKVQAQLHCVCASVCGLCDAGLRLR